MSEVNLTAREKWLLEMLRMNTLIGLNFQTSRSNNPDFVNQMLAEHEEYAAKQQAEIINHLATIKEDGE